MERYGAHELKNAVTALRKSRADLRNRFFFVTGVSMAMRVAVEHHSGAAHRIRTLCESLTKLPRCLEGGAIHIARRIDERSVVPRAETADGIEVLEPKAQGVHSAVTLGTRGVLEMPLNAVAKRHSAGDGLGDGCIHVRWRRRYFAAKQHTSDKDSA